MNINLLSEPYTNKKEKGQGMTEYILIVMLIAIGLIAVFMVFRNKLGSGVDTAAKQIDTISKDKGYSPSTQ